MIVSYRCPQCDQVHASAPVEESGTLVCPCGWNREISTAVDSSGHLKQCIVCGNGDLWRQKNFPQFWGVVIVAIGAIVSSVFYAYYQPLWAMGTLMLVALIDMGLYIWMPDVLMCYRCQTRHGSISTEGHSDFDHEMFEKYRQDAIRLQQAAAEHKDG